MLSADNCGKIKHFFPCVSGRYVEVAGGQVSDVGIEPAGGNATSGERERE